MFTCELSEYQRAFLYDGSNSLVLNLLVPVAVPVIKEPKLPIRSDLANGHAPRVEVSIGCVGCEHDGLALRDEPADSGEFLGEIRGLSGGLGVLGVA